MGLIFSCRQISKTYGDDTLFFDLSIDVKEKEQMGLIGMNGSGKSSFLKLLAGLSQPDTGQITIQPHIRSVYLEQDDPLTPGKTVEQTLYDSIKPYPLDEKERHAIVQSTLGKGGFQDPAMVVDQLSGGWKKRLAITRALCCQPDVLLLDEPTNHLDINGILWLENILKTAAFSFIVVSHDRAFLENVCQNMMEIARYYPSGYFKIQGGYTEFKKQRDLFLAAQQKQQASLASKMRREDEWLRQGAKARSTKAKYRIEQAQQLRLELMAVRNRNQQTAALAIDFHATGRQTRKLLRASHIQKTIDGNCLFSDITFELGPGFCLGVAGENGSGKSTFLSILEKKTKPDSGTIQWAENLKIAVFDQKRSSLNMTHSLKEALNPAGGDSVTYKNQSIHIVTWAKRFLFMPDQLEMPVQNLSGGEQARIILANIMLTPCDLLLLDEPTNDLDILSLEVLEDSIRQFPGAVVVVSHDRYLMDRICHRILYLDPGKTPRTYKNFDQIMAHRREQLAAKKPTSKKTPAKKPKTAVSFSFKEKFELEHIEARILEAEQAVEDLSEKIQDPGILRDADKMKHYCALLETAQNQVHDLYERWEFLEHKKQSSGLS